MPRIAVVAGPDDLAPAAEQVGFPCVLKVDAADVVHKSDAGGVALDLGDAAAVITSYSIHYTKLYEAYSWRRQPAAHGWQ